jgi:Fe-S cluster assembly protein SufD
MATNSNYENYSREMTPAYFNEALEVIRKNGSEAFTESGFPTNRTEQWRATDISTVRDTRYSPVELEDVTIVEPLPGVDIKDHFRVINGQVQSDMKISGGNHKGLTLSALSQGENFPTELIGSVEDSEGHSFYNLNTALFTDALAISVDDSFDKDQLIQVQYHAVSKGSASVTSNRTVIEVRAGATFNFIQQFLSEGKDAILSNSVTEIILHAGAKLKHTILVDEGVESNYFHSVFVHQGSESTYEAINLTPGAQLSRSDFQVFLAGEKAHADVRGLFVGTGKRVHNGDVTMHHRAKGCTSSSLFKGIGGGSSHAIFRGLVHVTENGAGTDAHQNYNSLVLTDEARITTEPHLLIYNDDVACSHGATVGQLDDKQLFYLETRGLNPIEAKKILIQSFAAEVVASLNSAIQEVLFERVSREVSAISE